tara:strand:+ start:19581 stop:21611 length:2031 start_codon:yes stop_codon:yes gene_type:complete
MLLERLFTDDVQYVVNTLGSTQITAFFEDDKYYLKMLCWPTGAVDEYSLSDCRNLATALFVEEADTLQLLDVPLQNFIPITRLERGTLTHEELMTGLDLMSGYFDTQGIRGSNRVDELLELYPENDYSRDRIVPRSWNYMIYQIPALPTDWDAVLYSRPETNLDPIFQPFRRDVMTRLPVIVSDLRVENFGFVKKYDLYLMYIFDCDVYWVEPFKELSGELWAKSNSLQLDACRATAPEDSFLRSRIYEDVEQSWEMNYPYALTSVELEQLLVETRTCLRNRYNQVTSTFQAEEVKKVKQYPVIYKKTATGTLQQWQVLLLPQEEGGYLLTTASGKVDGAITQGRGKLITEGKVNRTALEQAELEADSKFKKKQDEGYFMTKEEAMNNLVVLPMLAHDFKKRSHDIEFPAIAQRKFDGVRCLAITQPDGTVRLMTRKGKDFPHLEHLRKQIQALEIEPNMVLDGEVYSDSLTFQEATGLVRRQTLKPGDEDKMKQIDYRLYDAILLDEPKATFLDRYSKLAALFPSSSEAEGRRMGNLVLTENFPLRSKQDITALHLQFTGDEDFEGVMIRNVHGTYDLNKRSKHLQKFKEFQDAEYKIVGYKEAGGDWQGTPIWICEMEDGRQFNVTPVGDRPSRVEMFQNADDYIGKMLTVKFFELSDDGVPRFGNGIAIRDYE